MKLNMIEQHGSLYIANIEIQSNLDTLDFSCSEMCIMKNLWPMHEYKILY